MTAPMHADAGARALDALPRDEAAAFDEHVGDCEQCASEYSEFLATTAMLAAAVATTPPEGLRVRVLHAASITPQLPPVTATPDGAGDGSAGEGGAGAAPASPLAPLDAVGRHRQRKTWWHRPVLLVAAAVAAALIAGGVIVATHQGGPSPDQAAAQCVAAAPDARVQHPSVGAGGSVTVAPSCDAAVVQVAAMPQPPAGKAYQLWVMAGSAARSAGMVAHQVDASGQIVVTGLKPTDTDIGISVEPAGGSKAPTTTPVWVVALKS